MSKELDLGRGLRCWIEGDGDLAINSPDTHELIVLTREQFKQVRKFYEANAGGEES